MPSVTTIPATIKKFTAAPINSTRKRRVAGYARVSTCLEEQATSYAAQVDYYTNYIKSRADWEFVSVYTDEGLSGTSVKKREGFNRMIADALAGKIDLIITKSVSRFARNTVDSLSTIRKLKEHNVECYFEKEQIRTFDSKGELLITIMSSLAQEESRSISENVTWGKRKWFAKGNFSVPYSSFLGYDKGEDGRLAVNEEQAKTVRLMFELFIQGLSFSAIAKELERRGIKTMMGRTKWPVSSVLRVLENEKYAGNALLQKKYTADFLTKKVVKNEGQVPQYFIKGSHQHIIPPEIFDMVQMEIARRKASGSRRSGVSLFASKIKCAECGGWYGSKVWHSNDKYRRIVYRCNNKYKNKKICSTPHVTEEQIKTAFVKAVNILLDGKAQLVADIHLMIGVVGDVAGLEKKRDDLYAAMEEMIAESMNRTADCGSEDYAKRYEQLVAQFEEAKAEYEKICAEINGRAGRIKEMEVFLKTLEEQDGALDEFDGGMWGCLVDHVIVYPKDEGIGVVFRDGTEIRA